MNYTTYKFTELDHGFCLYFISPFNGTDLVLETLEYYVSIEDNDMNRYLLTINFDNVTVEKVLDIHHLKFYPNHFLQTKSA